MDRDERSHLKGVSWMVSSRAGLGKTTDQSKVSTGGWLFLREGLGEEFGARKLLL